MHNLHYEKFPDGSVKCIEDEIPFNLPEGWEWARLKHICMMVAGKPKPSEQIKHTPFEGSYPCFGGNGIRGYVDEYNRDGTFSIVGRQGALCGNINVASGKFYATEHAVITTIFTGIDFDWCNYILEALQLNKYATGAAQPGLSVANILNVFVPVPPLNEQVIIGAKVSESIKLIDIIEHEKASLQEIADKIKSKILDLAIRGKLVPQDPNDEPASVLLERIRAEKEELIKQGKIKRDKKEFVIFKGDDNSYYQDLPENWIKIRLSSISEIITKGTTPRGGRIAYSQSGIGFLRAENIAGYDKLNLSNLNYIDEESHNNYLKRSILKENDILITIAGTLGRTGIVPQQALPLNTNQAVAIIRLVDKNIINVKYLVYAINSPQIKDDLLDKSVDVAIPNLSLENIADCNIPFPPFAEQKRIVTAIEEAFSKLDKISESLA